MSSITKVTKSFTLSKLHSDDLIWILFQDSIELEAASHSLKNHIDRAGTEPINPHPTIPGQAALIAAEQTSVKEFEKKLEKWMSGEAVRGHQSVSLPPLSSSLLSHTPQAHMYTPPPSVPSLGAKPSKPNVYCRRLPPSPLRSYL
jgi:hypothetical protein